MFRSQRTSRAPSALHAEPWGPALPVGRASSPLGCPLPPSTSSRPAAPRRVPLSCSVNIYRASRMQDWRLLPHQKTRKFPKIKRQRRAGVWWTRPCSGPDSWLQGARRWGCPGREECRPPGRGEWGLGRRSCVWGGGPPHPSPIGRRGSGGLLGLLRVLFRKGEAGSQPSTDTWAYNPGAAPRKPGIRPEGLREGLQAGRCPTGHRPLRLGVYTWLQGGPTLRCPRRGRLGGGGVRAYARTQHA